MKSKNYNNINNENLSNFLWKNFNIPENFRLRVGLFLIIIGILWMGKIAGWFDKEIFGPLVMLTLGIWFLFTYFISRIDNKINIWTSSLRLSQGDYYGL